MSRRERFVIWCNKVYRLSNRITAIILFASIITMAGTMLYGAIQQKISSNITVTYSRPSYTVTFDPQGGGVTPGYKTVVLGDNYGDLPTPTRLGYSFDGWSDENSNIVSADTQFQSLEDITITAQWTAIPTEITSDTTSVTYNNSQMQGAITITASGGGGMWIFSVVSATRTADTQSNVEGYPCAPETCYTLSTTEQTTESVVLVCTGTGSSWLNKKGTNQKNNPMTYTYVVEAKSVYNDTTAQITLSFVSQVYYVKA